MRRRSLHQSTHPFNSQPFEAYWGDSWQNVERLRIKDGSIRMHVIDDESMIEVQIPISNIRLRPKKATAIDCTCLLRPGIDVSVFSTPQQSEEEDKEETGNSHAEDLNPVWLDAKISSIERKPHEDDCACTFYVQFYVTQGPIGMIKKALSKDITTVQIEKISIFQKLEKNPCEDELYRWKFSEDSTSRHMFKLFTGKFASDLTWLLVTSVAKQLAFDVISIEGHIVYQIWDGDSTYSQNSEKCSKAVTFRLENGTLVPIIVSFAPTDDQNMTPDGELNDSGPFSLYDVMDLRRSKRRNVQPERYLGCDELPDPDIDISRIGLIRESKLEYEDIPLALSVQDDHAHKTDRHRTDGHNTDRHEEMNNIVSCYRKEVFDSLLDSQRNNQQMELSSDSSDEEERYVNDEGEHPSQRAIVPVYTNNDSGVGEAYPLAAEVSGINAADISKIVSKYYSDRSSNGDGKRTSRTYYSRVELKKKKKPPVNYSLVHSGWGWKAAYKKYPRAKRMMRSTVTDWQNIYDNTRSTSSRRAFSAGVYREMIRRCMTDIDSVVGQEQPPILDQWKEFQSMNSLNQKDTEKNKDRDENQEEIPEKPEDTSEDEISEIDILWKEMDMALASAYLLDDEEDEVPNETKKSNGRQVCQHDYRLNEEIGIVCRSCGFVCTEIRYVSLPFFPSQSWTTSKHARKEEKENVSESKQEEKKEFDNISIPTYSDTFLSEEKDSVWALIPNLRDKLRFHQKRAFEFLWRNLAGSMIPAQMESARHNRGGCVISHSPGAGKTLLIIAFLESYLKLFPGARPLVLAPKTTLYTWYKEILKWDIPIPVYQIHGGQTYRGELLRRKVKLPAGLPRNQDVLHVLDCLEKIQRWLAHPSVLLMGYTSFLTLTRDDSSYTHRQYMAQVLRRCPGILILDEGHNPRSTKSRLRKGLMKVDTDLRVLLSGTLFQNNFGEYFNTLCLARPIFVDEVLDELDPKFRKKKKEISHFSRENRARKVFINEISGKINSDISEERVHGLNILKNLTSEFIDVYEGGSSDSLPGLQIYTLMMKSTKIQQDILEKLQNQRPIYKGFPLELELLITLGSIHPWLIRTTACAGNYFDLEELDALEKLKFDLKLGSKVRFVMSLVPRCLLRKEKVLIFCHNIAPINLFLTIFERFYGWRKGEEVLVLQGELELFERGRVMEKFEEPGGPSRVMLASISACCEGISLTAASRVILLDSEWNPSKSKQAIARAFRPGQDKVVYVYQLLATGTLEEEKFKRTTWKEWVSSMIFSEEFVEDPSQWQALKIEDELLGEMIEEDRNSLFHQIMKNEKASNGLMRVRD